MNQRAGDGAPGAPRAGLGDYQVDVNGDGYADCLTVDAAGAVRAWLNKGGTGTAGWTSAGQIASGADVQGSSRRLADIDADRRDDLLAVAADGRTV
ncbi:FG-GAP-like repeat-containing protein [Streptomyces sp. NPDC000594]|uniref:FG-GAP-like repeat-containing protein n=1 Tax=Streptomyces sp. NPDC000594 TaxID=3154261 RepID=UPI003326C860